MAYKQNPAEREEKEFGQSKLPIGGNGNGDTDPPSKTTTTSKRVKGGTEYTSTTTYSKGDPIKAKPTLKTAKDPNAYMKGLSKRFPGVTGEQLAKQGYIHPGKAGDYQSAYGAKPTIKTWMKEDPSEKIIPKPVKPIDTPTTKRTVQKVPLEQIPKIKEDKKTKEPRKYAGTYIPRKGLGRVLGQYKSVKSESAQEHYKEQTKGDISNWVPLITKSKNK